MKSVKAYNNPQTANLLNNFSRSSKHSDGSNVEKLSLPEAYEDIDEEILKNSQDVKLEELDITMLATDSVSALNCDFLDKDTILTEYWKDLKVVEMANGAILILKKDGTPMAWAPPAALKLKGQNKDDIGNSNYTGSAEELMKFREYESQNAQVKDEKSNNSFLDGIANVFKSTGATVCTTFAGIGEGIASFGESVVDIGTLLGATVATPFTLLGDGFNHLTGNNAESLTGALWGNTLDFVKTKHVKNYFDNLYETNDILKSIKENSYFFDGFRTGGKIVGEVLPYVVLALLTCGGSSAASGTSALATTGSTELATTSASALSTTGATTSSTTSLILPELASSAGATANASAGAASAATGATVAGMESVSTFAAQANKVKDLILSGQIGKKEALKLARSFGEIVDGGDVHKLMAWIVNHFNGNGGIFPF